MKKISSAARAALAVFYVMILAAGAAIPLHQALAAAPYATITAHPIGLSSETSATFYFTIDSGSAECQIDSDAYAPCTSPHTINDIPGGFHAFSVHIIGESDPDATDTFVWTVNPLPQLTDSVTASGQVGTAIAVTDLQVEDSGDETLNMSLEVADGMLAFGDTTDLTFDGDPFGIYVVFSGTRSALNSALATLTYTPYSAGEHVIDARITNTEGAQYETYGGHTYRIMHSPTPVTWSEAKTLAEASTLGGMNGYLASITSPEETGNASYYLDNSAWIGGTDADSEGVWLWTGGSEATQQFWAGDASGTPTNSFYTAWESGQPDDFLGDEDCVELLTSSEWNDRACSATNDYYIVEYGDDYTHPYIDQTNVTVTGTSGEQEITSCEQLFAIDQTLVGDTIRLMNTIDCSGVAAAPLVSYIPFAGVFDGQGFSIRNLSIDGGTDNDIGLFARTAQGALIKDVRLRDVDIKGGDYVGGVVGDNEGDFSNVHVSGSIYAEYDTVGAIAGDSTGSTATEVHATGTVTTPGDEAGGLFGYFDDGELSYCSFKGDVHGYYEIGGIVGEMETGSSVYRCFSSGTVTATDEDAGGIIGEPEATGITLDQVFSTADIYAGHAAGGLVGYNNGEIAIYNSYATGDVYAGYDGGGLVGHSTSDLNIERSYSTGRVIDTDSTLITDQFGGLIGAEAGTTAMTTFWDTERSGYDSACGVDGECTGEFVARNSEEMKQMVTFTSGLGIGGWNFVSVWKIDPTMNDSYPCLIWSSYSCRPLDADSDGITNDIEEAGPNAGDANDDGIPDSDQPYVSTDVNPSTGAYTVVETSCDANLSLSFNAESEAAADGAYSYPSGLLDFSSEDCGPAGATVDVTLYLYGSYNPTNYVLRKWNSTQQTYTTISDAVLSSVSLGGQAALKATYQVVDGGSLDQDGLADGAIHDPVGLALASIPASAPKTGLPAQSATVHFLALVTATVILGLRKNYLKNKID